MGNVVALQIMYRSVFTVLEASEYQNTNKITFHLCQMSFLLVLNDNYFIRSSSNPLNSWANSWSLGVIIHNE